uniref:Uncharacterized protein n=1 Tax=Cyanistes caeruleus TaxID=156563 RepID=A0A8C0V8D9_CYACU
MRISVTSIFHQPVLGVHIMSHQNSVFIAFINQHTNPAKVRSVPVSESSHWNNTEPTRIYISYITVLLDCIITENT